MLKFSTSKIYLLAVIISILFWQCGNENAPKNSRKTSEYDSSIAQDWMTETYSVVKEQGMFALDGSRTYAYIAITMHESMVHGIDGGNSLAGQLQGLSALPEPDPTKEYDWAIVLCASVPKVLKAVVPTMKQEVYLKVEQREKTQELSIQKDYAVSPEVMQNSKEFADKLASAIIDWSKNDSRDGLEALTYNVPDRTLPGNKGNWDGNTLGQGKMFMPFWWTSRPFVIPSYKFCEPDPPHPYSEDTNSSYYKEVKEVYNASFDPIKVETGKYWANNPSVSGTPAGSWIGIANQLVDQQKLNLPTTLKMYTLLSIGTRDAFIACWYMKYKYYMQRPITYVREIIGDKKWESPVSTPPYPDYTSGTSCNAGSSSTILTNLFGEKTFTDNQHATKGFKARTYKNFKEAAVEAYHSRIYAGVHMRRACEKGYEQGICIGNHVFKTLKFKK
jgi:hypothetical protein